MYNRWAFKDLASEIKLGLKTKLNYYVITIIK